MIDWLAGTFFATSLLMALVLLVRELVRRQFGPAAAYGLWIVPALRMLMPPLTRTIERAAPAAEPVVRSARAATIAAADPGLVAQPVDWQAWAVSAWLVGVAAMLLWGLLTYRWQRSEVLRDAVQLASVGGVRLVRSPAVSGPVAFGILDRVIAVPVDFDDRFDARERRLAFDHELSHHRSGDIVANHLAFVMLSLHWFNPLAWIAHSAFRFDLEASCDARVLDRASGDNRVAYARAITKAACGRALLFAGALDRPRTLHRRLQSMLTSPSACRRLAGRALIAVAAAAAVPMTASRATHYLDVPAPDAGPAAPRAAAPAPAAAPAAMVEASAVPATAATSSPPDLRQNPDGSITISGNVRVTADSTAFFDDDTVLINGKRKTLDQLTAAERTKLRAVIADSQRDLVRERERLPRELAEAKREADRARSGELRREHLRDIEDLKRELAEFDSRAAEMRAEGDDPVKEKARALRDLREAEAEDISREEREAIEEDNPAKRIAELQAEEQQMSRLLARLDQLDRR